MQNLEGYTTVTAWERKVRSQGFGIDGKWFRSEIAEERIPSMRVSGAVFVRTVDLEEAWGRYCAHRAQRKESRRNGLAKARAEQKLQRERRETILAEIDRKLTQVLNILEA
jgi:hypothetical protein